MEDNTRGFEIFHDDTKNILILQVYGFWDVEFGKRFEKEVRKKINEMHTNRKDWHLLMDFTKSPPQLQEIQSIFRTVMRFAGKKGMKKRALLVNGSIIELYSVLETLELMIHFS